MMPEDNFDQKLIETIKEKRIIPKPRWQFLLKNYVVWVLGLLSLLIGAGAISVMIYLFKFNDWDSYQQTHKTLGEFFLLTLPYFWIIILAAFIFAIYYNIKHTKRGYRYPIYWLALVSVAVSLILGASFQALGFGKRIDNILGSQVPFYDRVINRHVDFWSQPEDGRLAGAIIAVDSDSRFIIIDRGDEQWIVSASEAQVFPEFEVAAGQLVRLLGQKTADHEFTALKIFPINTGQEFFRHLDSHRSPFWPKMPGGPRPELRPPFDNNHPGPDK